MNDNKISIHQQTFTMQWGDMDALGHMNHARMFVYFQECRINWMAELDITLSADEGPILLQANCTYLKPLIHPTTFTVQSRLHTIGSSSFLLDHDVYENEGIVANGGCKIVWVNYQKNKSVAIPQPIREILA